MEDIMAGELDAIRQATIAIHIGQLEKKRQKLTQLDTEIADLIEKPEDLEDEILESEELQCMIAEQICRAKTFLENIRRDLTNTTVCRGNGTKHSTPQWNHHDTTFSLLRNKPHNLPVQSSHHSRHNQPN